MWSGNTNVFYIWLFFFCPWRFTSSIIDHFYFRRYNFICGFNFSRDKYLLFQVNEDIIATKVEVVLASLWLNLNRLGHYVNIKLFETCLSFTRKVLVICSKLQLYSNPGKAFFDIKGTIEYGFTLKRVRDMTRTYSHLVNSFINSNENGNFGSCYFLFQNVELVKVFLGFHSWLLQ